MKHNCIQQALAAGGTLEVSSKLPPKPYFIATMTWPGEDTISGKTGLGLVSALESLEDALQEDAVNEMREKGFA